MADSKKTRKESVENIQASWRAQEQRIKDNVIASSINAIAIAEFAGNLTYVNNSFLKMWGYDDKNEVLGKPAVEFWKGKEKVLEIIEALRDGDSVITELVAKRKDGSLFDVLCSAGVVNDETGTPICMLGSFMDITERKNTEEALRESEERYRAIFEQAADSIVLVDAETGELVEFNDRAHESLGYTREEFGELKIKDFDVIESVEKVAKHIKKVVREGADTFETKHRTKGGEIRDILISSRAISIGGKDFNQGIWRDITEQKRAEKVLRFSLNFLERANLKTSKVPLLEEFVKEIQEFTDCEAVGIRILDESGNIPYEAYAGFSKEFYELENSLSV
jgi:PAS domain S-box-containing protein